MSVHVEVHQDRSVIEGPLYRVVNTVTYATGISSAIFVYDTTTGVFSHVATPWDIEQYPITRELAQADLLDFYRQQTATVDYSTLDDANYASSYLLGRVSTLVDLYEESQTEFEGSDDHIYEAE